MIIPDLPRDKMAWDRWKAFHWDVGFTSVEQGSYYSSPMFTVFDTGEIVSTQHDPNPDVRGEYKLLNLAVWMVGDARCPDFFMPDGETRIPKAWLTHGGSYKMIIDLDTKRAVAIGNVPYDLIPERFTFTSGNAHKTRSSRVSFYCPGPGRDAVGGPIKLHRPASLLNKEKLAHAQDMFDAAKMRQSLLGRPAKAKYQTNEPDPVRFSQVADIGELTEDEVAAAFYYEKLGRAVLTVDHLIADI